MSKPGPNLTHIDSSGNAHMVDVAEKAMTRRTAQACGYLHLSAPALHALEANALKKGDPISVAQLAGIMGAKRTADLIPLCHPLPLSKVSVQIELDPTKSRLCVVANLKTTGQTGVEMEALTAVSIACLTLYDMLKAVDKGLRIGPIELREKTGGKSGAFRRNPA